MNICGCTRKKSKTSTTYVTPAVRVSEKGMERTGAKRCMDLLNAVINLFYLPIFKGTNLASKKSSNIPEIYVKMFGRFH